MKTRCQKQRPATADVIGCARMKNARSSKQQERPFGMSFLSSDGPDPSDEWPPSLNKSTRTLRFRSAGHRGGGDVLPLGGRG